MCLFRIYSFCLQSTTFQSFLPEVLKPDEAATNFAPAMLDLSSENDVFNPWPAKQIVVCYIYCLLKFSMWLKVCEHV